MIIDYKCIKWKIEIIFAVSDYLGSRKLIASEKGPQTI